MKYLTKVGSYEVSVFSLNAAQEASATSATDTFNTIGKTAVPADVTGLTAEQIPGDSGSIRLSWNKSTDLDVTHGGFVYVRHDSSKTDGTGTFSNAVDLIEAVPETTTSAIVLQLLKEIYILKFQDDGGRFSKEKQVQWYNLPDNSTNLSSNKKRRSRCS